MSMFCFQCQETAKNEGCTVRGVCGKIDVVSNLQDVLVFVVKSVANYSNQLRKLGNTDEKVNEYILKGLFITITNANFDDNEIELEVKKGLELRNMLRTKLLELGGEVNDKFEGTLLTTFEYKGKESLEEVGKAVGVLRTENEDVRSLREVILYGLKGMAAYAYHAYNLGKNDEELYDFYERALLATIDESKTAEELIALVIETGKYGVNAMALLDAANNGAFGMPEMTEVNIGVGNKPGILISGHDLKDIKAL